MTPNYISQSDLFERFKNRHRATLIDVRASEEFLYWNIYQSTNIPLPKLSSHVRSIPKDKDIITICKDGKAATSASVFLLNSGFNAVVLEGGLKKWNSVYDIVRISPSRYTDLTIFQVKRLGKGCLSYIVVLADKESSIIIDPTFHISVYTNFLKSNNLRLIAVLDTHIHSDHISGGFKLSRKFSVAYFLPKGSKVKFKYKPIDDKLQKIFKDQPIQVFHTPGHSEESVSIAFGKSFVFTGDTLFLDNVGRSDLGEDIEKDAEKLYTSIKERIFSLHDDIYVLPAHTCQSMVPGPARAATLRYVKRFNNIRTSRSLQKFITLQKANKLPLPENVEKITSLNRSGVLRLRENLEELEIGGNGSVLIL